MRLMNIFPQLAPKLANEISSTATATIVVLNILTSLTKRSRPKVLFYSDKLQSSFSPLNKLSKSKATGLDKISARIIRRECADLICFSQYFQLDL